MDNAYLAGQKLLCGGYSQYTPTGKGYFAKIGRYGKLPEIGAIQYNYNASMGRVSHVAIVVDCFIDRVEKVFTVKTIEGNSSPKEWDNNGGQVSQKTYANIPFDSVGTGYGNHIDGYGYPIYGEETCAPEELIKIAKGEIGYIEKASSQDVGVIDRSATDSEKVDNKGKNNFTKYGKWYGQNGVAWCQQFVSWCAWMACRVQKQKQFTGWKKTIDNRWQYQKNGQWLYDCWEEIAGRWYAFDTEGYMHIGWLKDGNAWYYLNPEDGAMLASQWLMAHQKWYYLTQSGAMAANAYVKDKKGYCFVREDGIWDMKYCENPGPGAEIAY